MAFDCTTLTGTYIGIMCSPKKCFATVAQLVEQEFCKLQVPSSNLGCGTIKNFEKSIDFFES